MRPKLTGENMVDPSDEGLHLLVRLKRDKSSAKTIDNFVFYLHHRVTFTLLIVVFFVVGTGIFYGDPIDCLTDSSVADVIDSYCWTRGTFTFDQPPPHCKF